MRKTGVSAVLLAALAAAFISAPAVAEDFFDNPRLVTEGWPQPGVSTPLTTPNPEPTVVSSIDPSTASEGTAGIVTNPSIIGPIGPVPPIVHAAAPISAADFGGVAPATVGVPATVGAPAAAGVPAIDPATYDPNTAATHGQPSVVSFVVPVQVPASMAYPAQTQQYQYQQQQQQQYQQQLQQQQIRQQQYQQQLIQQRQYEEQLRRQQYQEQQQYAAQQQQLAMQQQQIQQQMAALDEQRRQLAAQAMTLHDEPFPAQQTTPYAQPYAQQPYGTTTRYFDPNKPIPPQPPMGMQPTVPQQPMQQPQQPQPLPPLPEQPFQATQPLQSTDYITSLTNPSTGGEKPVLSLITPAEVKQALSQGVRLIMLDVRGELVRDVEGFIPGSVSVPYEPSATFAQRVRQVIPNANYPVVVYCRDGIWSSQAGEILAKMGYRTHLMGAYRLWLGNSPAAQSAVGAICTTCS